MFKNLFGRAGIITFVVLFVLNAILATVLFSIGFTSGFEGETYWSWDQYGATLAGLFGDLGSLFALLGGITILAVSVWIAIMLSKTGHHNWVAIWFIIGLVGGGAVLYKLVDWSSFGFGFGPVIVLVVFTAIETLITGLLQKRS